MTPSGDRPIITAPSPKSCQGGVVSDKATKLALPIVAEFEGFRSHPYPDPASPLAKATRKEPWGHVPARLILNRLPAATAALSGAPWTIGYGQTGKCITPDTGPWSAAFARDKLGEEVHLRVNAVRARAKKDGGVLQDAQVAALASFLFNVGEGRKAAGKDPGKDGLFMLKSGRPSTMWRKAMEGCHTCAADQFHVWNKAGGKVMAGLTRRRSAERSLYLLGV